MSRTVLTWAMLSPCATTFTIECLNSSAMSRNMIWPKMAWKQLSLNSA